MSERGDKSDKHEKDNVPREQDRDRDRDRRARGQITRIPHKSDNKHKNGHKTGGGSDSSGGSSSSSSPSATAPRPPATDRAPLVRPAHEPNCACAWCVAYKSQQPVQRPTAVAVPVSTDQTRQPYHVPPPNLPPRDSTEAAALAGAAIVFGSFDDAPLADRPALSTDFIDQGFKSAATERAAITAKIDRVLVLLEQRQRDAATPTLVPDASRRIRSRSRSRTASRSPSRRLPTASGTTSAAAAVAAAAPAVAAAPLVPEGPLAAFNNKELFAAINALLNIVGYDIFPYKAGDSVRDAVFPAKAPYEQQLLKMVLQEVDPPAPPAPARTEEEDLVDYNDELDESVVPVPPKERTLPLRTRLGDVLKEFADLKAVGNPAEGISAVSLKGLYDALVQLKKDLSHGLETAYQRLPTTTDVTKKVLEQVDMRMETVEHDLDAQFEGQVDNLKTALNVYVETPEFEKKVTDRVDTHFLAAGGMSKLTASIVATAEFKEALNQQVIAAMAVANKDEEKKKRFGAWLLGLMETEKKKAIADIERVKKEQLEAFAKECEEKRKAGRDDPDAVQTAVANATKALDAVRQMHTFNHKMATALLDCPSHGGVLQKAINLVEHQTAMQDVLANGDNSDSDSDKDAPAATSRGGQKRKAAQIT
jgi:hypothetical protein